MGQFKLTGWCQVAGLLLGHGNTPSKCGYRCRTNQKFISPLCAEPSPFVQIKVWGRLVHPVSCFQIRSAEWVLLPAVTHPGPAAGESGLHYTINLLQKARVA